MFDILGIDGAALVVSSFLAEIMTGPVSLRLEFDGGGNRLLADLVTHVGGACLGDDVKSYPNEQKQASLHM
jgi:hypothetical protein